MPKSEKIIGWEVRLYREYPNYPENMRRQFISRAEFGNSPIRDQKARADYVAYAREQGFTDIEEKPIYA